EGEVERLGSTRPIKVDVRLISASNRNLAEAVKAGQFREDLFYRLNVIPLEIPPLRARVRDIEMLAQVFTEVSCIENGLPCKTISAAAMKRLTEWRWPGNIRELQNVIERAVLLAQSHIIDVADLHIENFEPKSVSELTVGMTVEQAERAL